MPNAWWKEAVFYQIYPRSFQDSNADGIGDIQGILQRLDYLQWLGVDALWLSPVFPSPQKDFGYDISDYNQIDPCFGTLQEFDMLVAEAKRRGLRIVVDGVYNHSSDQHPWFVDSVAQKNGKDDWYIWRDQPNNWTSAFGGSAWRYHPERGQYYLHSFAVEQPDLNWRNPDVVEAILSSMEFWLERGISGFRLDVFNAYLKDKNFRNNPRRKDLIGLVGGLFYGYIGQEHIYDRDQNDILPVLRKMRALVDRYDAVLVGETLDERFLYDRAIDYLGEDGLHLVFHFSLLHSKWRQIPFVVKKFQDAFQRDWPTWVLGNHDFPRQSKRWGHGEKKRKLVALLSLAMRGTPFIYYGEEIGLPEAKIERSQLQDPAGKRYYPLFKGRDGARTPMQWTQEHTAGFTDSAADGWLPVQHNQSQYSVVVQQGKTDSILWFYRELLALRKESAVLRKGCCAVEQVSADLLSFRRETEDESWLIVLNFSSRLQEIERSGYQLILSTVVDNGAHLQPFQGVILKKD